MLTLPTTTVTITKPTGTGDPYVDPGAPATIATAAPAHISAPSGADARVGGDQELVDAVLLIDTTPALDRTMLVADDLTGERYSITWCRRRTGLGLDHQKAGLVAVKGGSNG